MGGTPRRWLDSSVAWLITGIRSALALVTRCGGGLVNIRLSEKRCRDGAQVEKERARITGRCNYSVDRWLVSCYA